MAIGDLVLHWAFDDPEGTTAVDSSEGGFAGTYLGTVGIPEPSPELPALRFADARSRTFVLESRHAVHAPGIPATLKRPNGVSISLWYRSTRLGASGTYRASELFSLGDNLVIRLRPDLLQFSKLVAPGTHVQCITEMTDPRVLDGKWHHIVAIAAPSGMTVYFDGVLGCTSTDGRDVVYASGNDLWIGRHAINGTQSFDGHIDDMRIYARALTGAEVAWLAAGGQ